MTTLKRAFSVLLFTWMCGVAFGQDIIVTKDAKRIEAQIMEVNVDNVKYKLFNILSGPVYTILKSEISSITYQNGTEEIFTDSAPRILNSSYRGQKSFLQMNDKEQENYLKINHPELYGRFHKGQKLSRTGKGLRIPGYILLGSGVGLMLYASVALATDPDFDGQIMVASSSACIAAGDGLILAGITLSAIGGGIKKGVQNEYREKYLGTTNPRGELQLRLSGNGIGLAYVF